MKKLSFYGMIISAFSGAFYFFLGSYSLVYPSQTMDMMSPTQTVYSMSWINISLGAILLGMLVAMKLATFPTLVRWNSTVMMTFGIIMLSVSIMTNVTPIAGLSLMMMVLAGLMLVFGLVTTLKTNPFGKTKACPSCGSRVVTWGKKTLTFCTSCDWYFGSIPNSTSIMITGDPGAGKTMLLLKLADLFLFRGRRCVFVDCDQPPDVIKKVIGEFHHSLSNVGDAISNQKFIMVDAFSSAGGLKSKEQYHTEGVFNLNEINLVMAGLRNGTDGSLAVFVDSVNPLFLHSDASSVLKFLEQCRVKSLGKGGSFVFSITEGTIEESTHKRLESLVDVVLEMKFAETGKGRIRRFRLTKLRGQDISDEWIAFQILPEEGMIFQPIKKTTVSSSLPQEAKSR